MKWINVKIGKVKINPNNPRIKKDSEFRELIESIKRFPKMLEIRPIVLNSEYMILGGDKRFKACKEIGMAEIPVVFADDLTEEEQREFIIKDNVSAGDWDNKLLKDNWDVNDLVEWGVDVSSWSMDDQLEAKEDDFDTTPPQIPVTVLGDLYEIGEHRLLCGDATCRDTVAKLMNGDKVDMVFTDPPYGIDWNTDYKRFRGGLIPSINKYQKIKNDEKEFDPKPLLDIYDKCFFFGANCFSDRLPKGNWIVWDKRFENNKAFLADAEVAWYNGSGAVYIIKETHQGFISSDKKRFHPTQKPVKLLEQIFEKIKAPLFLFDPYLGSGSTMVASNQLNRKCYGMELDPSYCDVIVNRMRALDTSLVIKRNGTIITELV